MKSIFPITVQSAYITADSSTKTGLVTSTSWDVTTAPLSFPIHVPQGERWLTHFHIESYIQGPNAPTYQTSFGVVLRGATIFNPATWGGPGSYWHPIVASGDAAWGSASIDLWLNPGITVVNFGLIRDAGAITVMRRLLNASPFMGMKI